MKNIKPIRIVHILVLPFTIFILFGCVSAPYLLNDYKISSIRLDDEVYDEIIVSGFLTAERIVSVTGSFDIETVMEYASVSDMSYQVASALKERGVKAEARDNFDRNQLMSNQLLLRGAVVATDQILEGYWLWGVPCLGTLGIFGMWAPSPFTYREGILAQYRVELIDNNGRYLLSTGISENKIFVKKRHIFAETPHNELYRMMRNEISNEIANKIILE